MLFNSFEYFLFLPAVVLLYFLLPFKWRNPFLLTASYYFYMSWKWEFGFLMLFTSAVNYVAGLKINASKDRRTQRLWLTLAIVASLSVLVYFKYANFFIAEASALLRILGADVRESYLKVILPVGISFFTFQALSYTIDLYKGKMHVERNFISFTLFVSFFPQLVAGPIERATNLLDQFKKEQHFSSERLLEGSKLIIWGLFKKVVIADRLAAYVEQIYASPELFGGSTLFLATFFFAFQIYCDFSGYSDIAIGSAHILGFRLMQNFNLPYLAKSVRDFWHRWHISLSTWFADYVYKPLGGNRVSTGRWMFNIMTVYLVSGLWHGANWTFIIWGGIFGFLYILEFLGDKLLKRAGLDKVFYKSKLIHPFRVAVIFLAVLVSWVFFRADNTGDAWHIITHMFTGWDRLPYLGSSAFETVLGLVLILLLYAIQILQYRGVASIYMGPTVVPRSLRWAGYALLLVMIVMFGVSSEQFIYFQF
ncbi:MAG: MBOAT family O-acyltransferase [Bacteroidales bacterium]|nr:MBOAT family O-acyltransferase [Bacteroidales bacterium]